jgi:hypothetical protein
VLFEALPRRDACRRGLASRRWPPETASRPAPTSSPSATRALARPTFSAPSATPSSKPDSGCSTPAPRISCRSSRPRDATSRSRLALNKLDRFNLIILDDIGHAQKDQAETSILFELIARRYETRSLAIAANQPFSAWDRIFPDPAVTVAAIDRLVHHAAILEMNVDSYRRREAADRMLKKTDAAPTTTADNLEEDATA